MLTKSSVPCRDQVPRWCGARVICFVLLARATLCQLSCSSVPTICAQGYLVQDRLLASTTFTWNGGYQYFTASPLLKSLDVHMWGGDGGGRPGAGAFVRGGVPFSNGEMFRIIVGRAGGSGPTMSDADGGGGGGASQGGGRSGIQRFTNGVWTEFATAGGGGAGYGCYMGGCASWSGQSYRYRDNGGNEASSSASNRGFTEPSSDCGGSTQVGGGGFDSGGGGGCCGYGGGSQWTGGSGGSGTGGGGGGGWFGGGAGQGPGGGGSSYTAGLISPSGSTASWWKSGGWQFSDAGTESQFYTPSSNGLVIFSQTLSATCPSGTFRNATFRLHGDSFVHCAPCSKGTFSHSGASLCSSCAAVSATATYYSANMTCLPAGSAPNEIAFFFSASAGEGLSHVSVNFTSDPTSGLLSFVDGPDGRFLSALTFASGGRVGFSGGATVSRLPTGGSPRSIAAWVRPSLNVQPANLLEWGTNPLNSLQTACSIFRAFGTGSAPVSVALPPLTGPTSTAINSPTDAILYQPSNGSTAQLLIAESAYHRILYVDTNGYVNIFAGTGIQGFSGDGGLANQAQLDTPLSLVASSSGTIFVSERFSIRSINAAGIISLVAGDGTSGPSGNGGPAVLAGLSPVSLAIDSQDQFLYFSGNGFIRVIDLNVGTVSHVMGCSVTGDSGDGGPASSACMIEPRGICMSPIGTLVVVDRGANRLRQIFLQLSTVTVSAIDFPSLVSPADCSFDSMGNLFVVDQYTVRVKYFANNQFSLLVGVSGQTGYGSDGTPANALLSSPQGIFAWSSTAKVYIADTGNNALRVLSSTCANTFDARVGRSMFQTSPTLAYFGGASPGLVSNTILTPGVWTHVAYTFDNKTGRLFINGTQIASLSMALSTGSADSLTIGNSAPGQVPNPYVGDISDVRVYQRALSQSELASISQFQSTTDNTRFCSAGFIPGVASCTPCSPGTYSLAGASNCTLCPAGTYGSSAGLSTSACSGTCSGCAAGTAFPPPSSSLTCASGGSRALPSTLGMRLWPAAHPQNPQHVDLVIAPLLVCNAQTSTDCSATNVASLLGSDNIRRYVVGSATQLNLEGAEALTCTAP